MSQRKRDREQESEKERQIEKIPLKRITMNEIFCEIKKTLLHGKKQT